MSGTESDVMPDADGKTQTGEATTGVYYVKAGSIRVGDHIMIDGRACKVVSVARSKTGKHGHAKMRVTYDKGSNTDIVIYGTEKMVEVKEGF